jgi:drug efflux transport system permease protein
LQTFRDKRMLGILFIAPIFQLIVYGYAATYDINKIPTAIIDYSNTQTSREMISTIEASGYYEVRYYPQYQDSLIDLIDRGDVWCGITIPLDFEISVKTGKNAVIQAVFDGSNSNTAGIAAGYLARIVQDYSVDIITKQAGSQEGIVTLALKKPVVNGQTRAWYNPSLSSRIYNVPAVVVMIMLVVTMVLTSMAVVKEKELGTIEQLSVTPIRSIELMLGKTLPFITIGVIDILLVTTVAIFWFKIPFIGSIWFLLMCSFIFMLTTLGTGLLISTYSSTQQQAMMTTFFFIMPFMILSGFAFPIANMPDEMQYVTLINPVRYFVEIVRAVFLKGSGFTELKSQIFTLFIIGLTVLTLSVIRFRKRTN